MQTALHDLEDATGISDPALHWGEDYRETVPSTTAGYRATTWRKRPTTT